MHLGEARWLTGAGPRVCTADVEGWCLGFNIPAEKSEGIGWFQAHGVSMPELQGDDHDEAGVVLMSPGGWAHLCV